MSECATCFILGAGLVLLACGIAWLALLLASLGRRR